MKYGFLLVLGPMVALAVPAVVACSSSDSGGSGGASGTGGSAGSGTGGSSGTGGASGASGSGGSAGTSGGKCTDQSDMTGLDACYGDGGAQTYQDLATQCGIDCILSGDQTAKCVLDCLQGETNNAVSNDCAGCVVASVQCGAKNCASKCVADPSSADCIACLCGSGGTTENCIQEYITCSGRDNPTCTTGPAKTCPADGG